VRVGINLLYLLPGVVCGTEVYAAGLLRGLAEVGRQHQYVVFVSRDAAAWPLPDGDRFVKVVCPVRAVRRWQRYAYEQTAFARRLSAERLDLVHSLGYVGPLLAPCPTVVTVHDTNFVDVRGDITPWRRSGLGLVATWAARRARCVITPSAFSRQRVCTRLKVSPERVFITPLAAAWTVQDAAASDWGATSHRYGIREPYIAALAGRALHKNIPRLVEAHGLLRSQVPHSLVVIGHPHQADLRACRTRPEAVTVTGYVPSTDLHPLLGHADVFVFPSLYEGFGLPVLEAQAAGIPVVCSRAAALPETAGDGAAYCDAESSESIAGAIVRCVRDRELRDRLKLLGAGNAARFSWQRCASQTLTVYERAVRGDLAAASPAAAMPGA
jgi:glycosyltransferase involved in cell wall biosynthesis